MRSDGAPALDVSIAPTWTVQHLYSKNGAASTPVKALTGTWFTGGSATTTKPLFLVEPTGTTSTGWQTAGTGIGVNSASTFTGALMDLQKNGASRVMAYADGRVFAGAPNSLDSSPTACQMGYYGFAMHNAGTSKFVVENVASGNTARVALASDYTLAWTSSTSAGVASDIGLSRNAAGVVEVNTGTAAAYRDIKLRNILAGTGAGAYHQLPVQTVSQLTAAATAGQGAMAFVTDATSTTAYTTVTGGGSNKVMVISDGTNWIIH
jgi:hypothetical protein